MNSGNFRKEKEKNSKVAQHDTSQLHNNKKHLLAHAILEPTNPGDDWFLLQF